MIDYTVYCYRLDIRKYGRSRHSVRLTNVIFIGWRYKRQRRKAQHVIVPVNICCAEDIAYNISINIYASRSIFCVSSNFFKRLTFQISYIDSRSRVWGTCYHLTVDMKMYKSRSVHFCSRYHRVRYVSISTAWTSKVGQGHRVQLSQYFIRLQIS